MSKNTSQSVSNSSTLDDLYPSYHAVDGLYTSQLTGDVCSHPHAEVGEPAWWKIDFSEEYVVRAVVIYNRVEGL